MAVKRVGILYHPMIEASYAMAKRVKESLEPRGVSVWLCSAWEGEEARAQVDGTDLVLSVGGDGTILRSAQAVIPKMTPITGINLGTLGFMTELSADEALDKLPDLLGGEGWIDERALLEAELSPANEKGEKHRVFYVLNDVVVARGAIARVVYVDASIDGKPMTTYKGDGVIVATATGSTGYSLAAGGPILYPQAEEFLLLPILPHLCSSHPVVLPASAVVRLRISAVNQGTLSVDGQVNLPLSSGDVVTVKHSPYTVRFLRIHPENSFYSTLEQKLKGK